MTSNNLIRLIATSLILISYIIYWFSRTDVSLFILGIVIGLLADMLVRTKRYTL